MNNNHKIIVLTFMCAIFCTLSWSQNSISESKDSLYVNKNFGVSVKVPSGWYLFGEKEDESGLHVEWGLPKVYDSIYKVDIENAVYIQASKSKAIKSVKDMTLSAYLNVAGTNTSLVLEKGIDLNSRIIYRDAANGAKYKGKVYFKYENGIGYRITFMATHGTYEKNLPFYESFISSLIFEKNH